MGFLGKLRDKFSKEKENASVSRLDVDYNLASAKVEKEMYDADKVRTTALLMREKLLGFKFGRFDEEYFKRWNQSYIQTLRTNPDALDAKIREASENALKWEISRDRHMKQSEFMRPNIEADISERRDIASNFSNKIISMDKNNESGLCFHATSIWTQEILSTAAESFLRSIDIKITQYVLDMYKQQTTLMKYLFQNWKI